MPLAHWLNAAALTRLRREKSDAQEMCIRDRDAGDLITLTLDDGTTCSVPVMSLTHTCLLYTSCRKTFRYGRKVDKRWMRLMD